MITQVSYARLYNIGNFENIRFEAVASVGEDGTALAFAETQAAVHAAYAQWVEDREREAAERKLELERRRAAKDAESLPF